MTAFTRLRLTNFRNYSDLDLSLSGRHVCLSGPNGAGKTNLMEAVSQFGSGRGLRSAALDDLTRQGASDGWTILGELNERRIGVGIERAGNAAKRVVRIDGETATPGDLAEFVRIVWLTPAMDGVFRGGASERRRFFDRQVMAHLPAHGPAAARYERAMRERNALLERPLIDPGWADAIEARMAEAAADLAIGRALVLERLRESVATRPDGAFPKAELTLDGDAEQLALAGESALQIADALQQIWRQMRSVDQKAGRTLKGPHRADLAVIHRPTGMPAKDASTGQQKALLIGIILASAQALESRTDGPVPILLLDEAAAHLDPDRRAALFDELDALNCQAWLTGTEAFLFEDFGSRADHIDVRDGTATRAT